MNQPLKLIGLTGPAGCGKDTVAQILCDTQEFRRIALAEPIRRGIVAMFGIPMEYLTDRILKEQPLDELCGKSPRQAMQTLGTEWGRKEIDLGIWLKVAEREIDYTTRMAEAGNAYINGIVVSDIRFAGEANWLRHQGGEIWHVYRPENPFAIESNHESENMLATKEKHQIIINDVDIDHLYEKIAKLMDRNGESA